VTIVVVDDEPTIVRMCVQVLQSKGHTVHGFTRADEALAHLTAQAAELLVVDYKMPELSGLEFIKANQAGVQTIVLKPFTPGELAEGIARAVGDADPTA